ncbi:MAG: periplasmic heavy metal sensor [Pseudomonadota bacterium]
MRRSMVLGWALAASLAVNAGLAGYLIRSEPPRGPGGALREIASALSSDGRAQVRAVALAARPEMRAARSDMRMATAAVLALLVNEDADPAELERSLADSRAAMAALHGRAQRLFVDAAADLSDADRAAFAEAVKRRLEDRPRGWR